MKDLYQKHVLILALYAGEIMMKNGAEIQRVEETIVRICKACRIDFVESFVTPTGIFLSLDSGSDDNDMHTFLKRIHGTGIDLKKIAEVDRFVREFTEKEMSLDEGLERLKDIAAIKRYPFVLQILAAMLVGAFLVPYYNGSVPEMAIAAIVSGIAFGISHAISLLEFPSFIRIFLSCFVAAVLVLLLRLVFPDGNTLAVLISSVSIFMPGVAITNAARDVLSGNYLSSVSHFLEALVLAISIAAGLGAMMALWVTLGMGSSPDTSVTYPVWMFFFFGVAVTAGFVVLFNAPPKMILPIVFIGGMGIFSYRVLIGFDFSMLLACFTGSMIVAVLSEIASRAGKRVVTIFILPSIIPFVPGAKLYQTITDIIGNDFTAAASTGAEALMIAGCIAIAVVLVASLKRLGGAVIQRAKKAPHET
jgi:uncharacterized membrane protein YjjP (DUF1212 family)